MKKRGYYKPGKLQQLNNACQRAEEATRRAWNMAVDARNEWHLCRSLHVDQEGVWESALRALADYKETKR